MKENSIKTENPASADGTLSLEKNGGRRILSAVLSVIVTVVLMVVWHFVAVNLKEVTIAEKLLSYMILLFGMAWFLDAVLPTAGDAKGKDPAEKLLKAQYIRALVGFVAFFLFSALAHAMVAVLFDNGARSLEFGAFEKYALDFTGFGIFMAGALKGFPHRKGMSAVYAAIPVIGLLLSFVHVPLLVDSIIMLALTVVVTLFDIIHTCKASNISSKSALINQIGSLAILTLVLEFRHLTPIQMANNVIQFTVSAVFNLILAAVVDVIVVLIFRRKNRDDSSDETPDKTLNKEMQGV